MITDHIKPYIRLRSGQRHKSFAEQWTLEGMALPWWQPNSNNNLFICYKQSFFYKWHMTYLFVKGQLSTQIYQNSEMLNCFSFVIFGGEQRIEKFNLERSRIEGKWFFGFSLMSFRLISILSACSPSQPQFSCQSSTIRKIQPKSINQSIYISRVSRFLDQSQKKKKLLLSLIFLLNFRVSLRKSSP